MPYTVEIAPSAEREIRRLERKMQVLVARRIDSLEDSPRPHDVKKLSGSTNRYRTRIGDYRIIYEISDPDKLVLILRVRHRSDAYHKI